MSDWFKLSVVETTQKLRVEAPVGLSDSEVHTRQQEYGFNELVDHGSKSVWAILWDQLKEIMVVILLISAIVSAFLGDWKDTVVILAVVLLNAILGVTQEYRAEQAIAALKKLAVPNVKVRRNGKLVELSARELVPGDVILLEAGNLVPADGRLIESINLQIQEAALTGESEAVNKHTDALPDKQHGIGDQNNMVFMGTLATYGRGTAVVTDTGMKTQLGNIATLIQEVETDPTPLQKRMAQLGNSLAWAALAIIAVVVILGLIQQTASYAELFLTAISMAVAAVPEGLPAVVAITLALGSQRMLQRRALIRKLPAVETLGSVTVICSDKTGTLTQNLMTVTMLDVLGHVQDVETLAEDHQGVVLNKTLHEDMPAEERAMHLLIKAGALCNDAVLQTDDTGKERAVGDPTEGALVVVAAKFGQPKGELEARWPRVAELPFSSERKRMTTIHQVPKDATAVPWSDEPYVAFTKGSVDGLLDVASTLWQGNDLIPLDAAWRERILAANAEIAAKGQRVLGMAFRPLHTTKTDDSLEKDLVFIGMVGMIDPPRPEVKAAVEVARTAGIRPIMITGDHPLTAQSIAEELTIMPRNGRCLTGADLAQMSVADLENMVNDVSVYARVSPEHKLNIVQALQNKGHIVAMTGDGVNDAPALKRADIGVAMGITGTDVSKEAADMVLLDDNFATIVAAVEEGRIIFDNIRKFIKYILSSNVGELMVMFIAPFLGMPLPLLPIQILWINLVTDGLPGLALAVEQGEKGIMKRRPFDPKASIFSGGLGQQIMVIGALVGLVSLGAGYNDWRENADGPWQTVIFTTLTLAQLGNALAIRSDKDSLFSIGFFSNRLMVVSVVSTIVLQLALIYVPFLQSFFHTQALDLKHLLISLVAGSLIFVVVELWKWILRQEPAQAY